MYGRALFCVGLLCGVVLGAVCGLALYMLAMSGNAVGRAARAWYDLNVACAHGSGQVRGATRLAMQVGKYVQMASAYAPHFPWRPLLAKTALMDWVQRGLAV